MCQLGTLLFYEENSWFSWFMTLKATFNIISVISLRSVEETKVHRENHRPVASH